MADYQPGGVPPPPGAIGLSTAEVVSFTTEDGLELAGWFIRPTAPPSGLTVLHLNGNAGHRGFRAPLAAALAAHGHASFVFDYRGYAGNPGLPSEAGLVRDARGALAYVAGREDVDPGRISYYGDSLGTALAVRLATEGRPESVILRSPFTSLVDVGCFHYPALPVRWILRDRFASLALISGVHAPLLVIATTDDEVVPFEQSERLYQAAHEPKWMVTFDGVGHNDEVFLDGPAFLSAILRFLQTTRVH